MVNGNFLEVLDGPVGAVFIDDRVDVVPDAVFQDFLQLQRGGVRWQEVLGDHDVEAVVWERSGALASLLQVSESWRVTFSDARWIVAERR